MLNILYDYFFKDYFMLFIISLQCVCISYFFTGFLKSDKPLQNFFILFSFLFFVSFPFSYVFIHNYFFKLTVNLTSLYIVLSFLFKENTRIKRIIAIAILEIVMLAVELIISILLFTIEPEAITKQLYIPWYLYALQIFLFFILYTGAIYISSKKNFAENKENFLLSLFCIVLAFNFFIACIIFSQSDTRVLLYSIPLSILIISICIFLFYQLYRSIQIRQKEMSIALLEKEYQKQLEQYLLFKDDQKRFEQLRHDIINYLEQIKRTSN